MGQNRRGRGPHDYRKASDVVFLHLRDTVFCTECELIYYNNSPRCLACGSLAVLSLSRVLGGSLRGEETARLVKPEEINSIVGEVLRATDSSLADQPALPLVTCGDPPSPWQHQAGLPIPALQAGVVRSCDLTRATGAAVAISDGRRMVCRARAGHTAPDIGAEVPPDGVTALSVRTGRLWRCDDTEREPWVNRNVCRALGIRSMVIAPLVLPDRVLGVLEVFSPSTFAFDDHRSATVDLIASALALAVVKGCSTNAPSPVLPAPDATQ